MTFTTLRIQDRVYLDHNATTPLATRVADQIPAWLENWGNPSSIHHAGRGPKTLMRESRHRIAQMVGVNPLELIFTSGGSEANNLVFKGLFEITRLKKKPGEIRYLVGAVEHPSIMRSVEFLRERGVVVDLIPVDRTGAVDLARYRELLATANENPITLVSMMLANNETGTIFPIRLMTEMAHAVGALMHTDAVQALGKIPLNLRELNVDFASFAGHKFYALKGAGFLYAKKGTQVESLIHGGGQERHRRGGTENMLAIASLARMCELGDEVPARAHETARLRDAFETKILREIEGASVTAGENARLPGTSSLLIPGVDGETLLMTLDMRGFSVSTGAACSSGSPEPSPVLLAMGLTANEAQSSLRVGLGWGTTESEMTRFTETLIDVVRHLRSVNKMYLAKSGQQNGIQNEHHGERELHVAT